MTDHPEVGLFGVNLTYNAQTVRLDSSEMPSSRSCGLGSGLPRYQTLATFRAIVPKTRLADVQ